MRLRQASDSGEFKRQNTKDFTRGTLNPGNVQQSAHGRQSHPLLHCVAETRIGHRQKRSARDDTTTTVTPQASQKTQRNFPQSTKKKVTCFQPLSSPRPASGPSKSSSSAVYCTSHHPRHTRPTHIPQEQRNNGTRQAGATAKRRGRKELKKKKDRASEKASSSDRHIPGGHSLAPRGTLLFPNIVGTRL